jgi:RNA polymerase sigma-70 factor (ECF subfamily)
MLSLDQASIDRPCRDARSLIVQARQGDGEAFGELCQQFESRLLRHAILLCGDVSLAEDLAQETFIEAWKCLGRYNERCQFLTWLCAILHNRHRRVLRRRKLFSMAWLGGSQPNETITRLQDRADDVFSPADSAQLREQAALVRRCVEALPAKQQQVVYLRFFVDDSLEGIAAALHCSLGTVKSRLFHALDKLRRMPALRESGGDLERKNNAL